MHVTFRSARFHPSSRFDAQSCLGQRSLQITSALSTWACVKWSVVFSRRCWAFGGCCAITDADYRLLNALRRDDKCTLTGWHRSRVGIIVFRMAKSRVAIAVNDEVLIRMQIEIFFCFLTACAGNRLRTITSDRNRITIIRRLSFRTRRYDIAG